MELTWTSLFVVLGIAVALGFWHSSLAAKEHANRAAEEACERLRLQFLDGTVAFASLTLQRGDDGRLALRRTYVFDYTADSIERRQGFVILTGRRLESVGFGSSASPGASTGPSAHTNAPDPRPLPGGAPGFDNGGRSAPAAGQAEEPGRGASGNVLDLAEWRRRPRSTARPSNSGKVNGRGE